MIDSYLQDCLRLAIEFESLTNEALLYSVGVIVREIGRAVLAFLVTVTLMRPDPSLPVPLVPRNSNKTTVISS